MKPRRTSRPVVAALATVLGAAGAGCAPAPAAWPATTATDSQGRSEDALRATVMPDRGAATPVARHCGPLERASASSADP